MNIEITNTEKHRLGLSVKVPVSKSDSKLTQNSFRITGPITFNALPKELRTLDYSNSVYKSKLDAFLSLILDYPRLEERGNLYSNTLESQLKKWIWRLDS